MQALWDHGLSDVSQAEICLVMNTDFFPFSTVCHYCIQCGAGWDGAGKASSPAAANVNSACLYVRIHSIFIAHMVFKEKIYPIYSSLKQMDLVVKICKKKYLKQSIQQIESCTHILLTLRLSN